MTEGLVTNGGMAKTVHVRKGNRLRGGDHTKNILFSSSLNKTKAGTAGRVLAINIFIEDDIQP